MEEARLIVACTSGTDLLHKVGVITGNRQRGTLNEHDIQMTEVELPGGQSIRDRVVFLLRVSNIDPVRLRTSLEKSRITIL